MVAEHVQGLVGLCKGLDHNLVFLRRIGKVTELQKGIGLFLLHRIKEGLHSGRTVVHHVLMQIGGLA